MNPTLLVVTAHPDDESFPIGGTIAKYAAEGVRVVLVCATRGEAGILGYSNPEAGRIREAELRKAAHILGISRLLFLDYIDGMLDQIDEEDAISKLLAIFKEENPAAVVTFGTDGLSGHPDHIAINRFVTRAFERSSQSAGLFYMTASEATQQGCGVLPKKDSIEGSLVSIDITDFTVTKVFAMQAHVSQNPPFQGDPILEAENLVCHEVFTVVKTPLYHHYSTDDLFGIEE